MTLEDCFTLAEMKNGLITSARVEDLVLELQKQKDWKGISVSDAARQWSIVARTLAATESKGCLNHFLELNGIDFLNQWLEETLKFGNDVSDDVVEELILAILETLERLPTTTDKLNASRIRLTVERMLSYRTLEVKDEAKTLMDKWNHVAVDSIDCQDLEKSGSCQKNRSSPLSDANAVDDMPSAHAFDGALCKTKPEKESDMVVSPETELHNTDMVRCSKSSQLDMVDGVKASTAVGIMPSTSLNSLGSSNLSNSCRESFSMAKEASVCTLVAMVSTGTCSSRGKQNDADEASLVKDFSGAKDMDTESNAISPLRKPVMEPAVLCNSDSKGSKSCSLSTVSILKKQDDQEKAPNTSIDRDVLVSERNRGVSGVHPTSASHSSKVAETKLTALGDQSQELKPECGDIDALEVTQQVASKVEQEVVDYREAFCSSSPEVSSRGIIRACSPDLVDKKNQQFTEEENVNVSLTRTNLSDTSSPKDNGLRSSEDTDIDSQQDQNLDSPKSTIIDQGSVGKTVRNQQEFDLNEDAFSEDFDCAVSPTPVNMVVSAPKAVVATTKGASDFPITPFCFEGERGWRGSAATSAFRPASPRKTLNGHKTCSNTKEGKKILGIDLNVADSEQEVEANLMSVKEVPVSSFPFGESSMELYSRRAERLTLDLNRADDVPSRLLSYRKFEHQNGEVRLSVASSSSSRQPSARDFDLNDNPSFFDVGTSCNVSKSSSLKSSDVYESTNIDDGVITIMGSRMTVERKDHVNQPLQSLLRSGSSMEISTETKPIFPHGHMLWPPGHNAAATLPFLSAPLAMYGPGSVSDMVDSREGSIIPQMLGTLGFSGSVPPLVMNVTSIPSILYGAGSSQSCLDLNLSMTSEESHVKPLHNCVVGEQPKSTAQPSTSGMKSKRKEPDWEWEPYSISNKK